MDFKGHFAIRDGRCHPLTLLDDHSRYALGIAACVDERRETVQRQLTEVFGRYGLPYTMLMDNGAPWGNDADHPHTVLTVWLLRAGIKIIHSRPRHPQTLGKYERFHRTLKAEVISACADKTIPQCQNLFDRWRKSYNTERPHEALAMAVPATRYQLSGRAFPKILAEIEYGPADHVRKVQDGGIISFKNRAFKIGKAFKGQRVAIRATNSDGQFDVFFSHQKISEVDWV